MQCYPRKICKSLPKHLILPSILPGCFEFVLQDYAPEHGNIPRQKLFCKKRVFGNFTKFTGKNLCWSLYFNKVEWHRCFPVKFAKFLRKPFLTKSPRWLLLRAPNFDRVPRLCNIQNTSNSLAKTHIRTPLLQNSSQWLLSNVGYFFLKGKTKTIFHTSSDLNRLQIICIKIKILLILYSKKTTRIFLPIFSIKNIKNHFVYFLFLC